MLAEQSRQNEDLRQQYNNMESVAHEASAEVSKGNQIIHDLTSELKSSKEKNRRKCETISSQVISSAGHDMHERRSGGAVERQYWCQCDHKALNKLGSPVKSCVVRSWIDTPTGWCLPGIICHVLFLNEEHVLAVWEELSHCLIHLFDYRKACCEQWNRSCVQVKKNSEKHKNRHLQ